MAGSKRRSRKKTAIKDNTFGMPTLLRGEDAKALHKLSERINKTVKPADALEEMWVADVVHLQWELQRLQESKAQLIHLKHEEGIREVLTALIGGVKAAGLLAGRKVGLDDAQQDIERLFNAGEVTTKTIVAQTMVLYLDEIERLERMILSAEVRRNNAIREVRFHRDALARNLRRACEEVEDGEFTEIPASPEAHPTTAAAQKQIETKVSSGSVNDQGREEDSASEAVESREDD
ncbi:hypothetical protein [Pseudolabrys sp. Root1462]|uniref:hypothetical protein n=1 Tax=Pseudolabrys sp. Root1462 TaxID=1736466 RepID=UPI0012E3F5E3|nr:hypothetical protein [Pseudolabrys sp. Root1462]